MFIYTTSYILYDNLILEASISSEVRLLTRFVRLPIPGSQQPGGRASAAVSLGKANVTAGALIIRQIL